jgi:hypothetical protein
MKTNALLMLMLLAGCGVLEDKKTFQLKSNGISTTGDYVMIDNVKSTETEFVIGSEVQYFLEGVSGFSIKDDMALFGASMTIVDQADGKATLQYDDLFTESDEGYSKEDASKLNFTLTVGSPMVAGGRYTWRLRVWDKRGKGELTAEMPFTVTEGKDLVGINTLTSGLKPARVFIVSNGSLQSTDVKVGQKLTLFFDGVEGYAVQSDSTVLLGASLVVIDKAGNNVLEYSDVFQQNPPMPIKKAKSVSLFLIVGEPMKAGETYLWKMILWDKNTPKSVESSISINVVAED